MRKLFYIFLGVLIFVCGLVVTNVHACGLAKKGAGNVQTNAPAAPVNAG